METLPNIDINIKCGNSLVSRFAIDADLKQALKKSKWSIDSYRVAVDTYRNAENKEQKREMERLITAIKSDFTSEIEKPFSKKISEARGKAEMLATEIINLTSFGEKIDKNLIDRQKKAVDALSKLETERDDIKANKIFENAFEWRFEFPEVLNDDGDFVGFDVVIGNPPYVQLQSIKEISIQLERFGYLTFTSMGDLYALFYEKGNQILKEKGILCFISGSAWMRTNYGQNLRTYFNNHTSLLEVIDLSDCDIFDSATVLTTIIKFEKSEIKKPIKAIRFTKKDQNKLVYLKEVFDNEHILIDSFPSASWVISDNATHEIKSKVELQGKKLIEWGISINYGIKTGYNDAFIIDGKTKDELIAKDPKSAEILKPLLRGRDVKKYYYNYEDLWLINTHNGVKEKNIPPVDVTNYIAVKEFLDLHWNKISSRSDKGDTPYNLRNCAYSEDFEKPKIIYPNMTKFLPFTFDKSGFYTNQKCFILTGNNLEYLVSFFNSKLFKYCFEENFPELQGNTRELNKVIFEQIPVKTISDETPFIEKVNQILAAKKLQPTADTTVLENQIDQLIYQLYDLTEEEIKIVEGN